MLVYGFMIGTMLKHMAEKDLVVETENESIVNAVEKTGKFTAFLRCIFSHAS